ncbi:hypothetical protein D5086_033962 [Populus alba]|uniref:Uncharacterized protein n=1 Tax=Populus alba TaxID=43335 RepID=A0ACC4AID1_POPAL
MLKRDHPNSKATEFRQPGHRSRNAAKLTESKHLAVYGRRLMGIEGGMPRNSPSQSVSLFEEESECRETHRVKAFLRLRKKYDVEQVAEAYMLKRDHPKFKGNSISATGASKSECRENHRVKAFGRLRKKSDVGQAAEAYMLKRDHPKFKGN